MPFVDIFHSGFRVANKVCLLAPGANSRDYYHQIPDDHQVIAISKAVFISDLTFNVWIMNRCDQDWFDEANRSFEGVRIFHYLTAMKAQAEGNADKDCYFFDGPGGLS